MLLAHDSWPGTNSIDSKPSPVNSRILKSVIDLDIKLYVSQEGLKINFCFNPLLFIFQTHKQLH